MTTNEDSLVQIKKTKSVLMEGNQDLAYLKILDPSGFLDTDIFIPSRLVFQILRGLVSYTQKYYRRKKNENLN